MKDNRLYGKFIGRLISTEGVYIYIPCIGICLTDWKVFSTLLISTQAYRTHVLYNLHMNSYSIRQFIVPEG